MRAALAVALLAAPVLATPACALHFPRPWLEPSELKLPAAADHPDADAVYLRVHDEDVIHTGLRKKAYTIYFRYRAVLILNESGLRYTTVRVPYSKEGEVLFLEARNILPGGEVVSLTPDNVYDDEAGRWSDDGKRYEMRARAFALPKVQVGSVVEYRYAVRQPSYIIYGERYLWLDLPTRELSLRYRFDKWATVRFKAYYTSLAPVTIQDGTDTVVSLDATDLPARPSEPFGLEWDSYVPRLSWAMVRRDWPGGFRNYHASWRSAVNGYFEDLYEKEGEFTAGFEVPAGALGGATRAERIVSAYRHVQAYDFLGNESLDLRKLTDLVAGHSADNYEMAALLAAILRSDGIDAQYALVRRADEGPLDPGFPLSWAFDHLVVYVPEQKGVSEPLWLDPVCWSCAPGEVPFDIAGTLAVLMRREQRVIAEDRPKVEIVRVTERVPRPGVYEERVEAEVLPDGALKGRIAWHYEGPSSAQRVRSDWRKNDRERRDMVKGWVVEHQAATAVVEDCTFAYASRPGEPTEIVATWTAPGYATVTPERIVVPLSVLDLEYGDDFTAPRRRADVRFSIDKTLRYVLALHVPEGYDARLAIEPAADTADFGAWRVDARRDGATLTVTFEVSVRRGVYPKARIDELRGFFQRLHAPHAQAITLVRRGG
jgi:hypothetical protein